MTITLTKTKLAIAVLVMALLVPATAWATHTFSDVPDGEFYTEAVTWAAANGITTGTTATTFEPNANVTRGQNVTFAKRYDDNIVQPALAVLETNQVVGSARVLADGGIQDIYMVNGNTPTVAHVAPGVYTITWPGINVNINTRRGFAQVVGSTAGTANLSSVSGDLIVNTFNSAGVATDMQFGVLIFDD
jgi:hypothetical protein